MTAPQQKASRPWVRILLIGSLGLNLLIVGLVAGSLYRIRDARDTRPPPSIGAMMFRELSREDRRALRDHAGERTKGTKEARFAEGRLVMEALRASPFDREALEMLLDQQAETRAAFQKQIQAAWLDRVESMTEAEREAYAERLQSRMRKDRKHKP